MRQHIISIAIAQGILFAGCTLPAKPALRIAISTKPGSAVLYLAQETGLFGQYGVDVHIVELNSGRECNMALADGHVDAVALPYDELVASREGASAGILMLLAATHSQCTHDTQFDHSDNGFHGEIEVLAGNRSELMLRRQDWQRVLLAYEHARLLLAGEPRLQAEIIALRESRSADEFLRDIEEWTVFGVMHQDSLLSEDGPFRELKAHWQGRQFLTAAASSRLPDRNSTDGMNLYGEKAK